MHLAASKHYTF